MAGKTLDLTIRIAGKMDKSLTAAINGTQGHLSDLTRTVSRIGTVGLAAMGAFATGTVAALAKCTNAAGEFENQMADVVKYVGGLADDYGKISDTTWEIDAGGNGKTYAQNYADMKDALMDLSTQIPMTKEELAQLAAAAGQSGKTMSDLIQYDESGNITGFLRDVAMMGTAMDISAEQAGDWAAKWEVAFGMSHDEIMVLADQINYLGANSATTAAEIAQAVNSAASLGQIGGIDVATTVAIADAMLATGVSADKTGTSIKRMVTNFSLGSSASKAMQTQWEELGFTAEEIAKSMQEDSVGTLDSIFSAINALPDERQVAALKTLFGQWAVEGGAKIVGNMDVYRNALAMVSDPSLYEGSMEREFIIKASTSEAFDTRVQSALDNLAVTIGDPLNEAKKAAQDSIIGFLNQLRDMPELGQIAQQLATLFSQGVTWAGNALQTALPHIQTALDYLINHGPEVVSTLGKIAAALAAMKFAPGITSVLGGIGSLVFGSSTGAGAAGAATRSGGFVGLMSGLFRGGQNAASTGASLAGGLFGASRSGGIFRAGGAMLSSLISGNGITGTTQLLRSAAGLNGGPGGALSGFQGIGSALLQRIGGTGVGQYLGSVGAAAGNFGRVFSAASSGALAGPPTLGGGVLSTLATNLTSVGGAGLQLAGTAFGPLISALGSVVAGATPVVLAISGIIAVLSLLWDNVDMLQGPIKAVFGDKGLEVFDKFKTGLSGVFKTIDGLFKGGLAKSLSGVREMFAGALDGGGLLSTIFGGTEGGLAAFDGVVSILQSVLGFIGQVVDFAIGTMKPAIVEIFKYVTGTVMPTVIGIFSSAAPTISSIVSSVGTIIMTVVRGIMGVLQALWPSIQVIVGVVMDIAGAVIPALLNAINLVLPVIQGIIDVIIPVVTVAVNAVGGLISNLAESIGNIVAGIIEEFNGIIEFIQGVFTGNWEQAWNGIKDIFGGAFSALVGLCKTPMNAVIAVINSVISKINGISVDIPDEVPLVGGIHLGFNIPTIQMLARGGFTNGPSIAGEAGQEAVISFQPGVRAQNIGTWMRAGEMLGVLNPMGDAGGAVQLRDVSDRAGAGKGFSITYAPNINIHGDADRQTVDAALVDSEKRFETWIEQNFGRLISRMERQRSRTGYA